MVRLLTVCLCAALIGVVCVSASHAYVAARGSSTTYGPGPCVPQGCGPMQQACPPQGCPPPMPPMPQRITKCKPPPCPPPQVCAPPACGPTMMCPPPYKPKPGAVWY